MPAMARFVVRTLLAVSLGLLPLGCEQQSGAARRATASVRDGSGRSRAKPQLASRGASRAPVEQVVQQHVEEADASGQRVIVYVGAKWCEPCQRFHKALESGQLDEALAGTKFVEFDVDRERDELRAAGYGSEFIPLFSVPDQSGHGSGRAIEGSGKGEAAVREDLVPRLLALLEGRPVR